MAYFEVRLHGPDRDLHSGVYGGVLANPATQLTRILGKLLDDNGRITIPGFYEDVQPVSEAEYASWRQLDFDENGYLDEVGATPWGENGS